MGWLILGGIALLGTGAIAADQVGDAAEQAGKPIKWIVAGGVVYVAYKVLKSGGAIK